MTYFPGLIRLESGAGQPKITAQNAPSEGYNETTTLGTKVSQQSEFEGNFNWVHIVGPTKDEGKSDLVIWVSRIEKI